jgi:DNA-binding SARP family transcriptional activator/Flp pilus assembly protein TadD
MMRFRILGSLEVNTGEDWTSIGAAKWRAVLACLLLHPGQVVSTDTLSDELWADDPPARASNLISIYVLRLRRLIGDSEGRVLRTRSPGYQLLLGPDDLDTQRFATLMSQGREALAAGDPARAAQLLADSLALWRGKALADVPPSAFVDAEAERLDELRLAALELRIEADIGCDRASLAIPDLRRLLTDQPLKEKLWLLLIRALDGAGRHAEALGAYEQARTVIADQLGVDPGPEMQQAFQRLLVGEVAQPPAGTEEKPRPAPSRRTIPARRDKRTPVPSGDPADAQVINLELARPPAGESPAGTSPPRLASSATGAGVAAGGEAAPAVSGAVEAPVDTEVPGVIALGAIKTSAASADPAPVSPAAGPRPMQLPSDIRDFTGRELHVEQLCDLLVPGESPGAVPVALVAGAGGLGKTTLAIHAAHQMQAEYPDGQLYVDLLGSSSRPLSPAEVLARLLRDLGVPGAQIPVDEDERAAMYRTRLNGRRMLVLLDNARDASQVRPLLPGSGTSAVIVTSRSRLPDLVGGGLVHLDVLDDHEALTLFSRIVGAVRTAAEPDATAELLVACAGLPLAIRISAARLAARSTWTIRSLADRLCDEHRRLDELKVGDLAVRASFEVSFASLPAALTPGGVAPARAFRMLGLWQGPSIGLSAAAALLGEDRDKVADTLEFLVDAHLLESPAPDCYSFHDLLRVYAAERAFAEEPPDARHDALYRIVVWYLYTASAANAVVAPQRDTVPLGPLPPGCTSLAFSDISGALDWCKQERANIVVAARQAAGEGLHDIAWKLPVAALGCFNTLSYRVEWLASHQVALVSARRTGDRHGEAWVLNNLGMVCIQQGMDDTIDYFDQALALYRDIGDRRGEAQAANNLADAYIRLGRPEDALEPLKRTLTLQIEVGHRYGQGVTLNNLGEAYLDLGRPEDAIDSIKQARSIFVEIKTLRGEGYAAHNLGRACLDLGRPDEAVRDFRSALDIRQAAGERNGQAMTLLFLGRAYRRTGRIDDARQSLGHAQAIFEDLADDARVAETRAELMSIGVPAG